MIKISRRGNRDLSRILNLAPFCGRGPADVSVPVGCFPAG
jgi:hypothetical protein